jgi:hypothetical protein
LPSGIIMGSTCCIDRMMAATYGQAGAAQSHNGCQREKFRAWVSKLD